MPELCAGLTACLGFTLLGLWSVVRRADRLEARVVRLERRMAALERQREWERTPSKN